MEKQHIYEKFVDLVECDISLNNHIMWDVRPLNCCGIAYVAFRQKSWRSLLYTMKT